MKSTFLVAR